MWGLYCFQLNLVQLMHYYLIEMFGMFMHVVSLTEKFV